MDALNKSALGVCAFAVLAALAVHAAAKPADHIAVLAGLGAGTLLAAYLEWRVSPKWKPRLVWIFPLWIVGIASIGGLTLEKIDPWIGAGTIAVSIICLAFYVVAESRKPGGRWVLYLAGSLVGILGETLLEDYVLEARPWWGYAIRGVLLVVLVVSAIKLWLARRAARAG